jgi:hypothetical protein
MNKAYVHLLLDKTELAAQNLVVENAHFIVDPEITYPALFAKLGFKVINTNKITAPPGNVVTAFSGFSTQAWRMRGKSIDEARAVDLMSIQFIDYVLMLN